MSNPIDQNQNVKVFYYLDRNNKINVDKSQGICGRIFRGVTSILRIRDYKILNVVKYIYELKGEVNAKENQKNIFLCIGKKLGFSERVINSLFSLTVEGYYDKKLVTELTDEISTDKTQIEQLKKLEKHISLKLSNSLTNPLEIANLKLKLKDVKLDPALADESFADINFLFKTRLIYSILGYMNSTASGIEEHNFIKGDNPSDLMIKKQGVWTSVKSIRKEFNWNEKNQELTSNTNDLERWNYFSQGLVPLDRFHRYATKDDPNYPKQNVELKPVAQLSEEEMKKVMTHALKFDANPVSPAADCVIQIFIDPPKIHNPNFLIKDCDPYIPVHCGFRLITAKGTVYSSGLNCSPEEYDYIDNHFLGSNNSQPAIMDYEEFRQHDGRVVVSLPTESQNVEAILRRLNFYRKNGIRFNRVRQNCVNLGLEVLKMGTGVDLNIPFIPSEHMLRVLKGTKDIPVLGLITKACILADRTVRRVINAIMPECVKKIFTVLLNVVLFVPLTLITLMKNLVVRYLLGGLVGSPQLKNDEGEAGAESRVEGEGSMEKFDYLLESMFRDDTCKVQHSSRLVHWQIQQKSTAVYSYTGQPNMNILPPETDEEKAYSEQQVLEFQRMYRNWG